MRRFSHLLIAAGLLINSAEVNTSIIPTNTQETLDVKDNYYNFIKTIFETIQIENQDIQILSSTFENNDDLDIITTLITNPINGKAFMMKIKSTKLNSFELILSEINEEQEISLLDEVISSESPFFEYIKQIYSQISESGNTSTMKSYSEPEFYAAVDAGKCTNITSFDVFSNKKKELIVFIGECEGIHGAWILDKKVTYIGEANEAKFSQDGEKVALLKYGVGMYTVDLTSKDKKDPIINYDLHNAQNILWINNTQILFVNKIFGDKEIYAWDIENGNYTNISENIGFDYSPSISLNGDVTFTSQRNGEEQIYKRGINDEEAVPLTSEGINLNPAWSPDGKMIAFISKRSERGNYQLFVMNADGTNQKAITHESHEKVNPESKPVWLSDNNTIAYGCIFNKEDICTRNVDNPEKIIDYTDWGDRDHSPNILKDNLIYLSQAFSTETDNNTLVKSNIVTKKVCYIAGINNRKLTKCR